VLSIVYLVVVSMRRVDETNPVRRPGTIARAGLLLAGAMALAACDGGSAQPSLSARAPSASTNPSVTGGLTSSATGGAVTVSDGAGARFVVNASPVEVSIAVTVNSFLWSAAPGQDFLVDNLTVKNPTAGVETLSDFDDLTSGLADDVAFAMSASDAASLGYSSDCAVDSAYPGSLCPISFGQGLTVDSDSADHDDRSAVVLSPGSTAQITLSYGPVLASVTPPMISVYFDGGISAPTMLSP